MEKLFLKHLAARHKPPSSALLFLFNLQEALNGFNSFDLPDFSYAITNPAHFNRLLRLAVPTGVEPVF